MCMSSSSKPHRAHLPSPIPYCIAFFCVQIALYMTSQARQAFFGSTDLLQRAERWKLHCLLTHNIPHLLFKMMWMLREWTRGGKGHNSLWLVHCKALSWGGSLILMFHQYLGSHCINLLPITSNCWSNRLKEAIRLALDIQVFVSSSQRFSHYLMPILCIFRTSSKSWGCTLGSSNASHQMESIRWNHAKSLACEEIFKCCLILNQAFQSDTTSSDPFVEIPNLLAKIV